MNREQRLEAVLRELNDHLSFGDAPSELLDRVDAILAEPVEPAPAQDEVQAVIRNLRCIAKTVLSSEARSSMRADLESAIRLLATRLAQAEQQTAYVECRECTDCGHVGINDAHPTDATCAMCDWSGPSPVEDQCPDCGKENAMGAACPKCSGRYRILAERG